MLEKLRFTPTGYLSAKEKTAEPLFSRY